ncbi:MAG: hypothetical protein WEA04_03635 [Candidatus Andersenbacteria bacterium]
MFKLWPKKKADSDESTPALRWDERATQGLEQALSQAPVPGPLKGRVKKELVQAAEDAARQNKHTTVTAEDLMQGLLAKLPASMRNRVEDALSGGPDKLQALQKDLENQK